MLLLFVPVFYVPVYHKALILPYARFCYATIQIPSSACLYVCLWVCLSLCKHDTLENAKPDY
jgi:hypothetical protein